MQELPRRRQRKALVFTAFVDEVAYLQAVEGEAAAALQDAVDGVCDSFGAGTVGRGLSLTGDGLLDQSGDLPSSRLQQSGCFIGDVDG
jgi:hypothetical protein